MYASITKSRVVSTEPDNWDTHKSSIEVLDSELKKYKHKICYTAKTYFYCAKTDNDSYVERSAHIYLTEREAIILYRELQKFINETKGAAVLNSDGHDFTDYLEYSNKVLAQTKYHLEQALDILSKYPI